VPARRYRGLFRVTWNKRRGEPPVFARLRDDRVLLDVRTLEEGDLPLLRQRLASITSAGV